jgi:hypothetical protein
MFYAAFPTVMVSNFNSHNNKKNWITKKLKTLCHLKRELYLLTRNSNNMNLLNYYKALLSKNTIEAKNYYNNNLIQHSKSKIATTWKIIKTVIGKIYTRDNITKMDVNGIMTCNPQIISNAMNPYFLSIADSIVNGISNMNYNTITNSPVDYLLKTFIKPFPKIKYNNITGKEIDKIIKSLKSSNSSSYDEISVKILKIKQQLYKSSFE